MDDEVRALLGLLAEPERLRILAALTQFGSGTVVQIARRTELEPRAVQRALDRLARGPLVAEVHGVWSARPERIQEVLRASAPPRTDVPDPDLDAVSAAVLRAFLRDGRLVSIPVQSAKKAVVLDHIARVFDIGVRYSEREVDALLRAFHDDYAALRRYLVDFGFLAREQGVYWRTGGSVEV